MKFKYKNDDCYFDSEKLDEIREKTKKDSKRRNKNKKQNFEEEFFKKNKH